MKNTYLVALVMLGALLLDPLRSAGARELDEACDYVYATLKPVKGAQVSRSYGIIQIDGKVYDGCTIFLVGDSNKGPQVHVPAGLLSPDDDSLAYKAGWRRDAQYDADGPDGTSFRIEKGRTVCLVEGLWDGGDDTDPDYVPSTGYRTTVRCATK